TVTDGEEPERVAGRLASADFLRVLGVRPVVGRLFTEAEDRVGAPALVVITDAYWHRHFSADPAVLNRKLIVDGEPSEIIGVLPPGFRYNSLTDDALYASLGRAATEDSGLPDRGNHNGLSAVGRLRPGATEARARQELIALQLQLRKNYPKT